MTEERTVDDVYWLVVYVGLCNLSVQALVVSVIWLSNDAAGLLAPVAVVALAIGTFSAADSIYKDGLNRRFWKRLGVNYPMESDGL